MAKIKRKPAKPAKAAPIPRPKTRFQAGQTIEAFIDDPDGNGHSPVGAGWRRFRVVMVGRKVLHLLYLPTVTAIEVELDAVETDRSVKIVDGDPRVQKRILKHNMAEREALGLIYSKRVAKLALAGLANVRAAR